MVIINGHGSKLTVSKEDAKRIIESAANKADPKGWEIYKPKKPDANETRDPKQD